MMHGRLFEGMAALLSAGLSMNTLAGLMLCLDGFYDSVAHIMSESNVWPSIKAWHDMKSHPIQNAYIHQSKWYAL